MRKKAAPEPCQGAAEVCTLTEKSVASRWRNASSVVRFFLLLCFAIQVAPTNAIDLTRAESMRIGRKIWENECGGTIAGLTSWNAGENFASLGIGHFIWYPKGVRGPFEESFPSFVRFVASEAAHQRSLDLPKVLDARGTNPCPWNSRAEFLKRDELSRDDRTEELPREKY